MTDDSAATLERELVLAELVSRVLDRGAVISGDIVISIAGIDLIYLGLRLAVSGIESFSRPDDPGSAGVARSFPSATVRRPAD